MEFLKNGAIAVEGNPDEIADQLINGFISPAVDSMRKIDKKTADYFTFCIAGKTISGHLATVETVSIDEAATALKETIDDLVKAIKQDKAFKVLGANSKAMKS